MITGQHYVRFDAPDLAPVIACEHTPTGWRGLTEDGELLNVTAHVNGTPVAIPDSLAMTRGDEIVGYRAVNNEPCDGMIADYVRHLDASTTLTRSNDHAQALEQIDAALGCARTVLARHNRAMILLALGRWQEGFAEFEYCEKVSPLFMRPQYAAAIAAGLEPWCGEDITGKKLLLIHDHGFGDSIMTLRLVPLLQARGADVVLQMPGELERLAAQVAPMTRDLVDADYVCSILLLLAHLGEPTEVMTGEPYLQIDVGLRDKWIERLGTGKRGRIGVAWSVGIPHDNDYPRAIPLAQLVETLAREGELVSVQQQGRAEAMSLDVEHFWFEDFADCAALMSLMDEIVTVDTAAVHLAGAIGHPCVTLLLSRWASWRWQLPLYRNLRICQQDRADDWESAFAKRCVVA